MERNLNRIHKTNKISQKIFINICKFKEVINFVSLLSLCLFLFGCDSIFCTETIKETYFVYKPIYMSYEELRQAVSSTEPLPLKKPGKIYVKDNYLFINEINEGIHVIDNTNPAVPVNLSFINIPGNVDIAVKNNILYADSYIDLVAIDISNPANVIISDRIESIFPYRYIDNYQYEVSYSLRTFEGKMDLASSPPVSYVDQSKGVVVGWRKEEAIREYEINHCERFSSMEADAPVAAPSPANGTGGSMARFTIVSDFLYTLNKNNLQIFNIEDPSVPKIWNKINVGWDIETIFPYKDNLFIGSRTGMFIFDNSDPSNPIYKSEFSHMRSCDPVVVQNGYAYVTLRGGGSVCGGNSNQLDIIDISEITSPKLVKTYAMQGPYGLGIDRESLFVCDGEAGLKVYDAADPLNLELVFQINSYEPYDVIPLENLLIVIGLDGLYQYDSSNIYDLKLLSSIPIGLN